MNIFLKGTAASAGQAEDIVRIVHGVEEIAQFQEGDVLVTEMTEP